MANYYGAGRSNYFKVKDMEKFEEWASEIGVATITNTRHPGLIAFYGDDECGLLPGRDADGNDINFFDELEKHLAPNSVCVFISAGAEKLRYVDGFSIAVKAGCKPVVVHLNDIYDIADKRWKNAEITRAEY